MAAFNADLKLRDQVAAHFSEAFRQIGKASGEGVHAEGKGWHRIHTRLNHFLANMGIIGSDGDLDAIQTAIEPLVSPTLPSCVIFEASDVSADAHGYLSANGFEHLGGMPLMAVRIERLPETRFPDGVEYARLGVDDGLAWGKAMAEGYGLPPEIGLMCAALIGKSNIEAYAAVRDGKIVSTSMACLHDGLAGIYCVATLPEARGQGLGSHLTAEPLRAAAKNGYELGILQSTEMGYSVYSKLGFEDVGAIPIYGRLIGPSHGPS